jgi:hypothetical protein
MSGRGDHGTWERRLARRPSTAIVKGAAATERVALARDGVAL